jgi:SWIM zinc finger
LIAMPARWSADSVLDLAPDESSRRSGAGLGRPAPWSGTGVAGDLLWGLCAGSGKNPYQVVVDLGGPAYKCSCPSRKFPCKHALGLLLNWANGTVPEESAPADFAAAWLADRRARAEKAEKSVVRTDPADSGSSPGSGPVAGQTAAARQARQRADQRAERVANGLAELRSWLRDQVLVGLSAAAAVPSAGSRGATPARGHADEIAARMIDAQAPGVAGLLRGLSEVPGSGEGWPGRLLGEYAQLHLLARAHQRLGDLPPELAATVRSRIGYPTARADVLARPAVTDRWAVLGVRDLVDGNVPGRRIWLRGHDSGRWAMLLTFAAPGGGGFGRAGGWQDPDTARLRPGTELRASLHYYPGQPALRAAAGERQTQPTRAPRPAPAGGVDALLAGYAAGLAQDPWLTVWPALLTGTPVPPGGGPDAGRSGGRGPEANRWRLIDQAGAAVPLADRESLWTLLAVSGGRPVTVAGEWHPDGLLALTVWHGDRAVAV